MESSLSQEKTKASAASSFRRNMQKWTFLSLFVWMSFTLICCNDSKEVASSYDPNKLVTIDYFTPDTGRVAEKVIIKGSNFGADKSMVSVLFVEEESGKENKAAIVGVDNTTIYCMAPRQAQGFNSIKVKVNDQMIVSDKTFKYSVSENVSTVAGDFIETTTGKDGTLAEATFGQMFGIVCIDAQSCIIGQAWNSNSTRYVSVDEDAVITIQKGNVVGKPAATKDGTKVYGALINGSNTVYVYQKNQAWIPSRVGDISGGTDVWAVALDGKEKWLYYITANGRFGRMELDNPTNKEIILENTDFSGGPFAYLTYSRYEDCFYVATDKNKILRVVIDDVEGKHSYEQINQNAAGTTDGYLDDAKFKYLRGLTVDEDGNIYVCQADHVIRKIELATGYVSTMLGTPGAEGNDDGSPKVALFHEPMDISYDGNGGFWIAQRYSPALRKYSIE